MLEERIRNKNLLKKVVSPEQAAALIQDGMIIGTGSGLMSSGPRMFFQALAERGKRGELKEITVWSASLLCKEIDGLLAEAGMLKRKLGSISDNTVRKAINSGNMYCNDVRAEMMPHYIRSQSFGKLDVAVVEAVAITEEGHIIPTTGLGEAPNHVEKADIVIVEINCSLPSQIEGMHDVYLAQSPPNQRDIPLYRIDDRFGTPYIPAGKDKITCILESSLPHRYPPAQKIDQEGKKMAEHFLSFLREEVKNERLPAGSLPFASGIGNASDAILKLLAESEFEDIRIFSPIIGDGVIRLIDSGKCRNATGPGLLLSDEGWSKFIQDVDEYKKKIILRSIDVSHDPGVIKRLGCVVLNNALEIDIYGHVNSTHLGGTHLVNGVGGGCVYAANASLSIFLTLSTGKDGNVSSFVPMATHVDHTEHSVDVIISEQGLADVRGLSPVERARAIINNCAHPDYRPLLTDYLERAIKERGGHEPHILEEAFSFHNRLHQTGSMKV